MGQGPEEQKLDPEGNFPPVRRIAVCFEGGPCDGEATMELHAPIGLSITALEFTEHPEGFYQKLSDGKYHWRLH